jgi:hypothetical protein
MWGKPYGSPHAGPDIAPAGARRNRQSRPAFPPPVRRCRRQHEHARQASSGRAKIKARRAPRGHRTRSALLPRSWAEVAPRTHRARGRPLASLASRTRPPPCDVRYASPFGFFRCGRCADATVAMGIGLTAPAPLSNTPHDAPVQSSSRLARVPCKAAALRRALRIVGSLPARGENPHYPPRMSCAAQPRQG